MSRNPFYNAVLALAYIVGLVSLMTTLPSVVHTTKDNIFMPMAALSLLVLSASVMAYLFFYQPVVMLFEGPREKAVALFLQTVGIFACGTLLVFAISIGFTFV